MQRENIKKANEIEDELKELEKNIGAIDEMRRNYAAKLRVENFKTRDWFEVSPKDTPDWFLLWLREHYAERYRALESELQKL